MGYVCFSASMAADRNSWTSGPQEVFEETCKVLVRLIIFVLWGFVFWSVFLLLLLKTTFMANAHQCHPAVFDFKLGKCESNSVISTSTFENFEYSCEV